MTDLTFWESAYRKEEKIWGDQPSELAMATDQYLCATGRNLTGQTLLDLGCGYGRDTLFLSAGRNCTALGIDPARTAIEIARRTAAEAGRSDVAFEQASFQDWRGGPNHILYAANLYQILPKAERQEFRQAVRRLLAPGGLLFLGNHTAGDPELAGKGTPVAEDPNSYFDKRFYHLCTREELEREFGFLNILDLHEQEFIEPRSNGPAHHHITWILIAEQRKESTPEAP